MLLCGNILHEKKIVKVNMIVETYIFLVCIFLRILEKKKHCKKQTLSNSLGSLYQSITVEDPNYYVRIRKEHFLSQFQIWIQAKLKYGIY